MTTSSEVEMNIKVRNSFQNCITDVENQPPSIVYQFRRHSNWLQKLSDGRLLNRAIQSTYQVAIWTGELTSHQKPSIRIFPPPDCLLVGVHKVYCFTFLVDTLVSQAGLCEFDRWLSKHDQNLLDVVAYFSWPMKFWVDRSQLCIEYLHELRTANAMLTHLYSWTS